MAWVRVEVMMSLSILGELRGSLGMGGGDDVTEHPAQ